MIESGEGGDEVGYEGKKSENLGFLGKFQFFLRCHRHWTPSCLLQGPHRHAGLRLTVPVHHDRPQFVLYDIGAEGQKVAGKVGETKKKEKIKD